MDLKELGKLILLDLTFLQGKAEFFRLFLRGNTTCKLQRRVLDLLKKDYGSALLRHLTVKLVKEIRNNFARDHSDSTADVLLSAISSIWIFADKRLNLDLDVNPTVGLSRLHEVQSERREWPQPVIKAFDQGAPAHLLVARKLAYYTGQRVSDLVTMDWAQFDGKWISVSQMKTSEKLSIPCHPELRKALNAVRKKSGRIIRNKFDRAYSTGDGLSDAFRERLRNLGIEGYSIHGLRKNATSALAEAGCSEFEIMAVKGSQDTPHGAALRQGRQPKEACRECHGKVGPIRQNRQTG
jgi:integrase